MNPHITHYFFKGLSYGPEVVADLVNRLPAEALVNPTHEDRFTPIEVVAHLADWEPIFQARIRSAVENPGATVQGYDEGERAIELDYAGQDIQASLAAWKASRAVSIAYFGSLSAEECTREMNHSELGPITAIAYAWTMIGHDMYHVEQLLAVLP